MSRRGAGGGGTRVVLHPSRPPGVPESARDLADRGVIDLVDAASDDEVAAAPAVPGSVLVTHRWRPDFLIEGLAWIQALGVGVDQFPRDELATRRIPLCNADSPLWDTPRLLLTGHSAALSPRWGQAWAVLFEANLAAALGERDWASRVG